MCDQGSPVGLHARLQVSVCSGYDLCHPGCPKIDLYILTPCDPKSRSNPTLLYIHVRCTRDANLVTAGPQVPEILHISFFCDCRETMKVGHCDLLFCVRSGFASGSSRARLQVSVYSGCDLWHPISQNLIRPFWYLWPRKVGQVARICSTRVRYTQDPNLVTAGQQVAEIMQI